MSKWVGAQPTQFLAKFQTDISKVHNGIEHGMMSALCEAWGIMNQSLDMDYEEIASVFDNWKSDGYFVSI